MARCSNCKAPLSDGTLLCAYCGNRNDVDLTGIHYYTTHKSETPRICPRCNVKLKTIDLKMNGTFLIQRCDECYGLFFDPGELDALLEATVSNVFEIDRPGLADINARRQDPYPVSYIKCPVCSQLMNRVNFGTKSGVIVDRCKEHGVWLDGGELRQLFEWMKLGGQLLENERQEQLRQQELKDLQFREKLSSSGNRESSAFDSYGDTLRRSDPDLFDIVSAAVRFFVRNV